MNASAYHSLTARLCVQPSMRLLGCALLLMTSSLAAQEAPAAPAPAQAVPTLEERVDLIDSLLAQPKVTDSGILTAALILSASFIIGSFLMRQKSPEH